GRRRHRVLGEAAAGVLAEDPVGDAHRVLAADAPLAAPAREARVHRDAGPDRRARGAGAPPRPAARAVAPRPPPEGRALRRETAEDPEVEVVQRAGADADQRLAGRRGRRRHLLDADPLGPAELVKDRGLHALAPPRDALGLDRTGGSKRTGLPAVLGKPHF